MRSKTLNLILWLLMLIITVAWTILVESRKARWREFCTTLAATPEVLEACIERTE